MTKTEGAEKAEAILQTYIHEHGQATGNVSWQMALQAWEAMVAYRQTIEAAWKGACPDTFERWMNSK